jgi:hypothetical protein
LALCANNKLIRIRACNSAFKFNHEWGFSFLSSLLEAFGAKVQPLAQRLDVCSWLFRDARTEQWFTVEDILCMDMVMVFIDVFRVHHHPRAKLQGCYLRVPLCQSVPFDPDGTIRLPFGTL